MNEKMLKRIYELSKGEEGAINENEFLKSFPDSQPMRKELQSLVSRGYVSVDYRDDKIHFIYVLKKTLDKYRQ